MTEDVPEVTVVIPTRDRPSLARAAVRSALAQRDVAIEVVVVDDASAAEAGAELERVAGDDERVTLLRLPRRRGVSRARNAAIEIARAERVAFLDDDDLWAPGYLRLHLEAAERTGAGLTYASRLIVDLDRRPLRAMLAEAPQGLTDTLRYGNAIGTPSCVVARTELLRAAGGFEPTLSALADWYLWVELAQRTTLAPVPELAMAYTVHDGNMQRVDPFGLLEEFRRMHWMRHPYFDHLAFRRWLASELIDAGDRRRAFAVLVEVARHSDERWRDGLRAVAGRLGLFEHFVGESQRPLASVPWLDELRAQEQGDR